MRCVYHCDISRRNGKDRTVGNLTITDIVETIHCSLHVRQTSTMRLGEIRLNWTRYALVYNSQRHARVSIARETMYVLVSWPNFTLWRFVANVYLCDVSRQSARYSWRFDQKRGLIVSCQKFDWMLKNFIKWTYYANNISNKPYLRHY